uniref:Uncharacterized protein n=1 Tax=Anguilla anguilla TaxID=7936 RepID=A0A0E9RDY1_ANGAN
MKTSRKASFWVISSVLATQAYVYKYY